MQINVMLSRDHGTSTTQWKLHEATRNFTKSCCWPTKSKRNIVQIRLSLSRNTSHSLIICALVKSFFKWGWWKIDDGSFSLSGLLCQAAMCGHTGCNRTPSGIVSSLLSGHDVSGSVTDRRSSGLLCTWCVCGVLWQEGSVGLAVNDKKSHKYYVQ